MAPIATHDDRPQDIAIKPKKDPVIRFANFNVTDQVFYVNDAAVGIVNLKPIVPGHVLVIPRKQYKRVADIPAAELGPFFAAVQNIGKVIEQAYAGDSLSIAIQDGSNAGQTVDHVHVHILPRRKGDIEPNDLVYEHLERFGLELNNLHSKKMDSERSPRTKKQMQAETKWLREQCAEKERSGRLPVTLLSGFLGAGKTTLMRNILSDPNHGMRIAVIVNDMGELNIDAQLIARGNHSVTKRSEQIVEMTNGCVCCTLRGDLLEEVANLARDNAIDYLLIESSGISEPMQVCETFSEEFAEMHKMAAEELEDKEGKNARLAAILEQGGLPAVARLDTCCTVVDAANMLNDFHTADFLVDRHGKDDVPEEDDRNISDLMVDQIEFADCIVVNKCDMVSAEELKTVEGIIKHLNPVAKVITTSHGGINPKEVIDTNRFSYEKAATSAGWLRSLSEELKPETEEYGIGSFVYRARRPFHPERLWSTIRENFVVIQAEYIDDGEEEEEEEEEGEEEGEEEEEEEEEEEKDQGEPMQEEVEEEQPQLNPAARLKSKKESPIWSNLLRSKGFMWLATRPLMFGEWSQAGIMLTLTGGARWRCELAEELWPKDPEIVNAMKADFDYTTPWGDRRQELVFIGTEMRTTQERITEALNACLLNDEEWESWQKIMNSRSRKLASMEAKQEKLQQAFMDGFEDWLDPEDPQELAKHEGHEH